MAQITQKDSPQQTSSAQDFSTIAQIVQSYNRHQRADRHQLRFAIKDLTKSVCGKTHIIDNREEKTLPLLKAFYKSRVEYRCRNYKEINESVFTIIANFLTNSNGRIGLLLNGYTGTGKTTMALAIIDTIKAMYSFELSNYDNQLSLKTVKATELGAIAKNTPAKFEEIKKAKILFIDDIGFNGDGDLINDYGTKRIPFVEILEYRYDNQLMTIATSNLPVEPENGNESTDTFLSRYGRRVCSRMLEMFSEIQLGKQDFRTFTK